MVYAIIKVINGTYTIHAEGITDLTSAKVTYHGLCQVLWNASDVYTGCVAIVDEYLNIVPNYSEIITHEKPDDNTTTEE